MPLYILSLGTLWVQIRFTLKQKGFSRTEWNTSNLNIQIGRNLNLGLLKCMHSTQRKPATINIIIKKAPKTNRGNLI